MLLSGLMAFSLFACTDPKNSQEKPNKDPVIIAYNTIIQDSNGENKCFWPDGEAIWDNKNHRIDEIQSATLSLQTEYDISFFCSNKEMEVSNREFYYPTEFEYDKIKIDIKESDKPNHFILTVLQPCDKEEIIITLNPSITIADENGKPTSAPSPKTIKITISTNV